MSNKNRDSVLLHVDQKKVSDTRSWMLMIGTQLLIAQRVISKRGFWDEFVPKTVCTFSVAYV